MAPSEKALRAAFLEKIRDLLFNWEKNGLPPRNTLVETAAELRAWKRENGVDGLWTTPPRMLAATLDDGLGHGIALVRDWAETLGMRVRDLGLSAPARDILSAVEKERPDALGLTVLYGTSEDGLVWLGKRLPPETVFLAGGAAFRLDPELAERARVSWTARNAGEFLRRALAQWPPDA
jgi:hypothetical protein